MLAPVVAPAPPTAPALPTSCPLVKTARASVGVGIGADDDAPAGSCAARAGCRPRAAVAALRLRLQAEGAGHRHGAAEYARIRRPAECRAASPARRAGAASPAQAAAPGGVALNRGPAVAADRADRDIFVASAGQATGARAAGAARRAVAAIAAVTAIAQRDEQRVAERYGAALAARSGLRHATDRRATRAADLSGRARAAASAKGAGIDAVVAGGDQRAATRRDVRRHEGTATRGSATRAAKAEQCIAADAAGGQEVEVQAGQRAGAVGKQAGAPAG
ncbi:MAG: hypothetical protein U5M50_09985, partial [Sphingobium sp.]|nr:hypothetical protein [Sphingobium sp.]